MKRIRGDYKWATVGGAGAVAESSSRGSKRCSRRSGSVEVMDGLFPALVMRVLPR
jgi:hypothetical protein